jgi:hypothetical protein
LFCGIAALCAAQKVAITFDDLPLNGICHLGVTAGADCAGTLAVLKARHAAASIPIHQR